MRKLAVLVLMVLATVSLVGCQSSKTDLEYILDKETFVVGFTDFPPMGYTENGKATGFDIELAEAVMEKLGVKLETRYIDWDAKVLELKSKKIDAVWNGLTITEERKLEMTFSNPYFDNNLIIIAKTTSNINTIADLEGKNIGVENQSSADIATAKNQVIMNGVEAVKKYNTSAEAMLALNAGQVDAVIVDEIYARYKVLKETEGYSIGTEIIGSEQYGVGFRLGDEKLSARIDEIIDELYEDGTITELSIKYFGVDLFVRD
ncbi:MAG: amino acid ABC transporter substrate-binding protein [Acholeplasma sp.]|nr:amino acid ABC transporter substrate-binding protein [Acholeplasma sp.]